MAVGSIAFGYGIKEKCQLVHPSNNTRFAPYASSSAVLDVLNRLRDVGLPNPVTLEGLASVGVPTSMASLTMRALKFLGLIDDEGQHQRRLQDLRLANALDYPVVLSEVVQSAYPEVFEIVDPAKHGFDEVANAFRPYVPQKQRDKMVRLFLGLCEEASLAPEQPKRRSRSRGPKPRPRIPDEQARDPHVQHIAAITPQSSTQSNSTKTLMKSFVAELPDNGKWTSGHRDKWLAAVTSAVDLMISVSDDQSGVTDQNDP